MNRDSLYRLIVTRIILVFLLLLLSGCQHDFELGTSDVTTSYGVILGYNNGPVRKYMGIPYAAPPTGNNRWKPPQAAKAWSTPKLAMLAKPGCIQASNPTGVFIQSEDCLYLNVWRPKTPGPHPVIIWIHGGAFILGSGTEKFYDPEELVSQKDVIVVSLNYRLSFLGHMSLPELSAETGYNASGNQGFLDQLAAIKWVSQEIANFDGDPNNITLFGHSAGAASVCQHLISPLSTPFFHKVILQSGTCETGVVTTLAEAEAIGMSFSDTVGCPSDEPTLECLRKLPIDTLLSRLDIPKNDLFTALPENWAFTPALVKDNYLTLDDRYELIENGAHKDIPVLMGVTKNEGTIFEYLKDFSQSETVYQEELVERFGVDAAAVEAAYPFTDYPSIGSAMTTIRGDEMFICSAQFLADKLSLAGHEVFLYQFIQPVNAYISFLSLPFRGENMSSLGIFHGSDLPYVFGNSTLMGLLDTGERKLTSSNMMDYWSNFVRTGNPNEGSLPFWPAFSDDFSTYIELGPDFQLKNDMVYSRCDVWSFDD